MQNSTLYAQNKQGLRDTIKKKAEALLKILSDKQIRLSLAESCTGGLIATFLTDVSGSSDVFVESLVTYANDSKMQRLRVSGNTLEKFGAVSSQCVEEMTKGLLLGSSSNLALSVSGIAGPTGGTEEKPVGTVYFALADRNKTNSQRCNFDGDREEIRLKAALRAFEIMELYIEKGEV